MPWFAQALISNLILDDAHPQRLLHRIGRARIRFQQRQVTAIGQIAPTLQRYGAGQGEQRQDPLGVERFQIGATKEVGIVHQEHASRQLRQERIGSMQFGLVIPTNMQPDPGMAATFRQEHRPRLRISAFAVLIAAAPKGVFVGCRIG